MSCALKKRKLKEKEREQEKKKKKKEKVEKRAKGPITESWGKYGIIKELDMWLVSLQALFVVLSSGGRWKCFKGFMIFSFLVNLWLYYVHQLHKNSFLMFWFD